MKSANSRSRSARSSKGRNARVRAQPLLFRHLARTLQAVDRWKGDLVLLRVLARSLAQLSGWLFHIQKSSTI